MSVSFFSFSRNLDSANPQIAGVFKLELFLPDDYPMTPPKIRFLTKIYHPNIDKLGRICLDVLKSTYEFSRHFFPHTHGSRQLVSSTPNSYDTPFNTGTSGSSEPRRSPSKWCCSEMERGWTGCNTNCPRMDAHIRKGLMALKAVECQEEGYRRDGTMLMVDREAPGRHMILYLGIEEYLFPLQLSNT